MLRINCPICGLRDETEFSYGGDAALMRPAMDESDERIWHDYVFIRDNPRGAHTEYWHHVQGCRQFLVVERDTLSHAIGKTHLARNFKDMQEKRKHKADKKAAKKSAKFRNSIKGAQS